MAIQIAASRQCLAHLYGNLPCWNRQSSVIGSLPGSSLNVLEQRYIDHRSRDFALLDALVLAKHGGPLYENPTKFGRGDQKELLSVAVFVYVVFLPFFTVCEAARVIGGGRVWRLFSARPTAVDACAIEEVAGT